MSLRVAAMELEPDELQLVEAVFVDAAEACGLLDPLLEQAAVLVFGGSLEHMEAMASEFPDVFCVWVCNMGEAIPPNPDVGPHAVIERPLFPAELEEATAVLGIDIRKGDAPEPVEEAAPGDMLWFDDDEPEAATPEPEPAPTPEPDAAAEAAPGDMLWFDDEDTPAADSWEEDEAPTELAAPPREAAPTAPLPVEEEEDLSWLHEEAANDEDPAEQEEEDLSWLHEEAANDEGPEEQEEEDLPWLHEEPEPPNAPAPAVEEAPAPSPAPLADFDPVYGDRTGWTYPTAPANEDDILTELTSSLGHLPTLPSTYQALVAELLKPTSNMSSVAAVVERAPGLAAQVLQTVNSALFGLPRKVTSVAQAVTFLGFQQVRDLVLALEVFQGIRGTALPDIDLDTLQERAQVRASLARALAPRKLADVAYTVGLLGELGRMVLVAQAADRYIAVSYLKTTGMSAAEAEADVFGVPSGTLGGRLMEEWQLPYDVVEAVRRPAAPGHDSLAGLVAIADLLLEEAAEAAETGEPLLLVTREMLAPWGREARLDVARDLARTLARGHLAPPVQDAA